MKRILVIALLAALAVPPLGGAALAQVPPPAKPEFHHLDTDKDGKVTLEEVMAYALKKSNLTRPFSVDEVDADHDGKLTPEELKKAGITGLEKYGVIDVKELDIHGDGYVSREDLDEYFRRKHREEFRRADEDKNGSLHPSEFALFRF